MLKKIAMKHCPKNDIRLFGLIFVVLVTAWPVPGAAQLTKLQVAYPTTVGSMAVVWITKEGGYFARNGLDVALIYIAGSSRVVQAMLARELAVAEIAIPAVIQANLAGADLVMLAGPNHKPGQKLMVKPEIKRPEEVKGRKLGVTRFGTSDDFLLRYLLARWGLQPDREVPLIQMGGSQEILAGLASGSVDGGVLSSPLNLRALKLGFHMLVDLSAIGVDYQGAGVVTTRSFVRENADTIRRYLKAYVEGLHRFKTDPEFSLKVLAKYSRITERDMLEETYRHYAVKVMPRVPYPTVKGIQLVLDEIAQRNPKAKAVAPESLLDLAYLKEIEASGLVKSLYEK
ncbi:MAG: ABC transporter substrate-binding protein [Deltaproteobacteria bacterium]|nr:ABC transporter substrate-binding protein [Deltaproteobacteria bacterium]